jgi:hypothetical protein
MIVDNRIPAGEVDDMHVSQTKTMIQVAIQTPLDPSLCEKLLHPPPD